jgi:hypothetical protein
MGVKDIKMPNTNVFNIKKYIIDDYFFNRLQERCYDDEESCFCNMDYEEFLNWNIICFEKLPEKEKTFIETLCSKIKADKVNIMDEETCVSFTSQKIFFDLNNNLVITCPR